MKNILKKVFFLLAAVFLAFGAINGIVYLMLRGQMWETMYLRLDWELMDSLKPGFQGRVPLSMAQQTPWKGDDAFWQLSINSKGLRGPENIPAKSSNLLRIICLGDSTTFGLGVDDQNTYPAQLRQILRAVPALASHRIEVLNAGVQGYSSRQGLVYLNNRLLKYHPDIVIVEFGYNDSAATSGTLAPSHNQMLRGDIDQGFKKIYRAPASLAPYLFYQTPLTVFIKYLTLMVLHGRNQARLQELAGHTPPPANLDAHEISALEKKFAHANVPPGYFLQNLNQFAQLAGQKHFELIFYIPYVIHPAYRQLLLMTAREHNIPVVDFSGKHQGYRLEQLLQNPSYAQLLDSYRRHIGDDFLRKNNLYLVTVDCLHPNAVGNRIIAEDMAKAIISQQRYIP